jgi:membrane protein implicated in regulation of membrane protease activity
MKEIWSDPSWKLLVRIFASPRFPVFVITLPESGWKLIFLAFGALIPIVLALLPVPAGLVASGLIIVFTTMICMSFRGSLLDWGVLAAIGFVLIALAIPAMKPDHSRRNEWERRRQAKLAEQTKNITPQIVGDRP